MLKIAASTLIVMGLVLSTVHSAFAQYPLPGTAISNVVAQNLDTTNASDGELQYYSATGSHEGTDPDLNMGPKAVKENKTADAPVPSNFNGAAVIVSDRQVGAIVSVQHKDVPGDTGDPKMQTQGAYNATGKPDTELFFPSVFRFGGIVSRLTVQNVDGTNSNKIELTFTKRDGTAAGKLTTTLNPFGSRTFYLGNASDVPANFPADFVDGSVFVKSLDGRNLAGAAVSTWPNRAASYQALTNANKDTLLYAPSHFRFINNAPSGPWHTLPNSSWTLFSALNIQNTSDTTVAQVELTYTARGASTPSLVKNIEIQPLAARGLNTKTGGDFPATDFEALSKAGNGVPDWDGSVKIESKNGVELVGVAITNWGSQGYAGSYALVGPKDGKSEVFMPAQYRLHYADDGQWSQWSAINLMNVGTTSIANSDLSIQYIDQAGNEIETFTGGTLPGSSLEVGAAVGLNTRNGGDLDASAFAGFPTDGSRPSFIGGIYAKGPAGSKLVAVGNIVYFNRASVYNGATVIE